MQSFMGDSLPARALRPLLIAVFAAVVAVAGVFSMPPLDRDEARFAQASVQMLESGDFIAIRFQNEERNKKPAGIHWLQAASVSAFSSVEAREIWAYRIPSLLGAILAALFTYAAGARLYGPATATLAALLLASAPAVAGEATIAKTDAMLLACVAAAQAAFTHIFGAIAEGRRASLLWAILFWIAIGAGVLIKGPIILMIIGLTGAAMALNRPRADWILALRPATGFIILLLMIAPWTAAIQHATEGRFFVEALGGDMVAKLGQAKERHGGPPGYYAALLFILLWPAAALIPPGLRQALAARKDWRAHFLLSWIIPAWIVFELTATKLPHYTMPLYPAIAIIAAKAASDGALLKWPLMRRLGALAHLAVGLLIAALIAAAPFLYGEEPLAPYGVVAAAAIAAMTLLAFILQARGQALTAAGASILASSAAAWVLLCGVLPNLDRLALSPRIAEAVDAAGLHPLKDGAPPVILSGYSEPSAIFLLGTDTILANGKDAADTLTQMQSAAIVEARENNAFRARIDEIGARAELFAEIEGLNYSNGDNVRLHLYRLKSPLFPSQDSH
ncbi:MAG: ArnT family glycosyltransferase [Pseudomonadota bacterium]